MSDSGDRDADSPRSPLSAFEKVTRLRVVTQGSDLGEPVLAGQVDELRARVKKLKRTTHAMLADATFHVLGEELVLNFAHAPIARQFSISLPDVVLSALATGREPTEAERLVIDALGADSLPYTPARSASKIQPQPTGVHEMRSCWLRLVRSLEDAALSGSLSGARTCDISTHELEVDMPAVLRPWLTDQRLDEIATSMTILTGRHVSTYAHGSCLRMRIAPGAHDRDPANG